MDSAIGCFVVLLMSIVLATLVLMVATSTAVFYYQDEDETGRYSCYYFTGTGAVTTSIKSSTGCRWFINTVEEWTEKPSPPM